MGNTHISSKAVRQTTGASSPRHSSRKNKRSSEDKNRPLEDNDLDDIYAFIMDMKQGDENEDVLNEFVLKQSSRLGGNDEIVREEILAQALRKKSLAAKSLEPPVRQIVVMRDMSSQSQRHRPRVSPSA